MRKPSFASSHQISYNDKADEGWAADMRVLATALLVLALIGCAPACAEDRKPVDLARSVLPLLTAFDEYRAAPRLVAILSPT